MRSLLRLYLNFLDTRFPVRVTVTQAKYDALAAACDAQGKKIEELQGRVGQLEAGIRGISMQMGFAGKIPGEFNLER